MAKLGSCQQHFKLGGFSSFPQELAWEVYTHDPKHAQTWKKGRGNQPFGQLWMRVERTSSLLLRGVTRSPRKWVGNLRQHARLETTHTSSRYTATALSKDEMSLLKPKWVLQGYHQLILHIWEQIQALARFWSSANRKNPARLCVKFISQGRQSHKGQYCICVQLTLIQLLSYN